MQSFVILFNMLSVFGLWNPFSQSKTEKKILFNLYRIFIVPFPYLLELGLLCRMILSNIDLDSFMETLFLFLSTTGVCFKSMNYILRRGQLKNLLEMLTYKVAKPRNNDELLIQDKHDKLIRCLTYTLIVLAELTVFLWLTKPFFQAKNQRTLPFQVWLPFDNTQELIFWMTYIPDSIAINCIACVSIVNDSLISGFMIAACNQLEILSHRFINVPRLAANYANKDCESRLMAENIRHHNFIFKYVDALCNAFSLAIAGQFIASSLVISVNIYQLSTRKSIDMEFLTNFLYFACMMTEFFVYCWFGNELIVKSQEFRDSLFRINWISLSPKSKKQLLFICFRASKPIVISNGHFFVLSLNSFTTILKTSYSVFNVLRTSSA